MSLPRDDIGVRNAIASIKDICKKSNGRSQFFPYGGSGYKASVTHYFDSSTEVSAGAVQPGSVEDLKEIMNVLTTNRVRFAIKCGGHSTNPGFSSTDGIQVYMVRFNEIIIDKENNRVRVGAGCLFEELYRALAPENLNIVGGSGLAGVGVTGWMLGGGYSTKTSRLGLGIDNVLAAKIVLPSGDFKEVSKDNEPDLFLAIKGGCNNFGIITEFTLETHKQGKFYDFLLTYKEKDYPAVKQAIAKFVNKTDNRANIEATFRYHNNPGGVEKLLTVHCVYDGKYPSKDPFAQLRAIDHKMENYGDVLPPPSSYEATEDGEDDKTEETERENETESDEYTGMDTFLKAHTCLSCHKETYEYSHPSEVDNIDTVAQESSATDDSSNTAAEKPQRPMAGISQFPRGRWGNVMVSKFTPGIIDAIEKQTEAAAKDISSHGGRRVAIGMWPFTKSMFNKAKPSAWPHKAGEPNCPILVYFTWEGKDNDAFWVDGMKKTLAELRKTVHKEDEGSVKLPTFISTALWEEIGDDVEKLYRDNLKVLKHLRKKYDPSDVMKLTGGFRIPFPGPNDCNDESEA